MSSTIIPARHGWSGFLQEFTETEPSRVVTALQNFVSDAGRSQKTAWQDSIRLLHRCLQRLMAVNATTGKWGIVLEYELPLEARRIDVVLLAGRMTIVIEFKGKSEWTEADVDQTHAYARDLHCYHEACHEQTVFSVLVPSRAGSLNDEVRGVLICGPTALLDWLLSLPDTTGAPVTLEHFLAADAYRPLPTLVEAARELFQKGDLRRVHRAAAITDKAVQAITQVARDAAATQTRRLVLLTGVPGAGKTLVGLRVVHSHILDGLALPRQGRKPAAPAVFLSGNGPLVEVLQYELRSAGGGGKAFVRGVKDYVVQYERSPTRAPPEHVLVFDEAQRAYDAAMIAEKHKQMAGQAKSEPQHFIDFASRVPGWCVVVGLIGGGQEINRGEEAGLAQWTEAIRRCETPGEWKVHGPPSVAEIFAGLAFQQDAAMNLDQSLRSHLASELHRFVAYLLDSNRLLISELAAIAATICAQGHDLLITRGLEVAKTYLRDRYAEDKEARFGIVASSRDNILETFGVDNRGQKRPGFHGPWYGDPEGSPRGRSCRELRTCQTEFGAQGLELDAVLLAWGSDFRIDETGAWSITDMRPHRSARVPIVDPWQLRANAYRVLLTRARDTTVVFVPPRTELDATYTRLRGVGFRALIA